MYVLIVSFALGTSNAELFFKDRCFIIFLVLIAIQSMLSSPLLEEPFVPEIARIYQADRALFELHARWWTAMYANGDSKPLQFLCRLAVRRQLLQAQPALLEDEPGRRRIADRLAGQLPVRLIDYIVG